MKYRVTLVPGGGYDTRLQAPAAREVLAALTPAEWLRHRTRRRKRR